nr:MAG TPA: hypothetical protein [Caudoviricetes sp.]
MTFRALDDTPKIIRANKTRDKKRYILFAIILYKSVSRMVRTVSRRAGD